MTIKEHYTSSELPGEDFTCLEAAVIAEFIEAIEGLYLERRKITLIAEAIAKRYQLYEYEHEAVAAGVNSPVADISTADRDGA